MKEIIAKLADFKDLSSAEMTDVIERIVTGQVEESQIAAFLLGLKMKGETIEERTALAQVMRGHAKQIPTTIRTAMDNCGTGGDKSFSFNVSTTAAFVLAGGGVKMAKHGNRSISSKSGSADVLEALGINLDLDAASLGKVFERAQREGYIAADVDLIWAQRMFRAMTDEAVAGITGTGMGAKAPPMPTGPDDLARLEAVVDDAELDRLTTLIMHTLFTGIGTHEPSI